jgi:hypothetical protein
MYCLILTALLGCSPSNEEKEPQELTEIVSSAEPKAPTVQISIWEELQANGRTQSGNWVMQKLVDDMTDEVSYALATTSEEKSMSLIMFIENKTLTSLSFVENEWHSELEFVDYRVDEGPMKRINGKGFQESVYLEDDSVREGFIQELLEANKLRVKIEGGAENFSVSELRELYPKLIETSAKN